MTQLTWIQLIGTLFVLIVSLIEGLVLHRRQPGSFDWGETWLSLADHVGRRVMATLPLNVAAPVFAWAWQHRLYTIELQGFASFALLFVGLEFFYYWYHRTAHRVRFFWATHVVHHTPNQISLTAALRLGWTGRITGTTVFFTPLVLIGFRPEAVLAALAFNLLYQFWLHTTWIPKLGWLEYVLNTPSSHRVHHASNLGYLDANYGGVLIVFDRLFGTYAEERREEPCVYGLVHPLRTRNLLELEFHEWRALWADLRASRSIAQAVLHLLMPPGWAPDGRGQTTEELRAAARIHSDAPVMATAAGGARS
jgi:sterol desaturase/sphingolipid hydroxylase (fatty acid hydroxylase superfamily)